MVIISFGLDLDSLHKSTHIHNKNNLPLHPQPNLHIYPPSVLPTAQEDTQRVSLPTLLLLQHRSLAGMSPNTRNKPTDCLLTLCLLQRTCKGGRGKQNKSPQAKSSEKSASQKASILEKKRKDVIGASYATHCYMIRDQLISFKWYFDDVPAPQLNCTDQRLCCLRSLFLDFCGSQRRVHRHLWEGICDGLHECSPSCKSPWRTAGGKLAIGLIELFCLLMLPQSVLCVLLKKHVLVSERNKSLRLKQVLVNRNKT
eukprot:Sro1096_g240801.2  (256) ;mRNA; f:24134-25696